MIATRPPLLSPSEILWEDQLQQISSLMQTHKVIFVRGKPGIGKTTLLRQVEKVSLHGNACFLDFRNQVSASFALASLCDKIEKPYLPKTANLKSELPELIQHTLQAIEETGKVIVWDNVHQVEDIAGFFSEHLASSSSGVIVASCREFPPIDSLRIMDCGFVELQGFSLEQTQDFLERVQLNVPSEQKKAIAPTLQMNCQSNPMMIRWTLAPFLVTRQALTTESLLPFTEAAHEKYVDFILREFDDPKTQSLLKKASLVCYSNKLERNILRQIPSQTLSILEDCGIVSQQGEALYLSKALRASIQKTILNEEKKLLSASLVEECGSTNSHELLQEKIHQLLILGEKQKSAELLSECYASFIRIGDNNAFLRLGESCFELLSCDAFVERRFALNARDCLIQTDFETTVYLSRTDLKGTERATIMCYQGTALRRLGRYSEATAVLKEVLTCSEASETCKCLAKAILARILFLQGDFAESNRVFTTISKLDHLELSRADFVMYNELLTTKAFYLEALGEFEEALKIYEEIRTIYSDSRSLSAQLLDRLNIANTKYRLGRILEAMQETEACMERYSQIISSTYSAYINYDLALHMMNQGNFNKALELLNAKKESFSCLSNAKSVALYCISWIRGNKNEPFENLELKRHSSLFLGRDQSFLYLFEKLNQDNALQDLNLLVVASKYDQQTDLRISMLNLLLELRWKVGEKVPPLKLSELRSEAEKRRVDFFIQVERDCLIGLHYLSSGKWSEAKPLLEKALRNSISSEFFIWEVRSRFGLACLSVAKGNFLEAVEHLERALVLSANCQNLEDLGIDKLLKFAKLEITPELFRKETESHLLLAKIFEHSRIGSTSKYMLKNKLGVFEIEAKELQKSRYPIFLDLANNKLQLKESAVDLSAKPVLKNLMSLLLRNPGRAFSKEELIERVWMETYNPLHHDNRIYTTLKRVRQMFNEYSISANIEHEQSGYKFVPEEDFAILEAQSQLSQLSERQQWILNYLTKNKSVSRAVVEKTLKISSSLAGTELKTLVDQGWLETRGQGKSTAYQKRA